MLFFHDNQPAADAGAAAKAEAYSQVKVITTIDNGAHGTSPHQHARACSYPFSLAGNNPLPGELYPTLIVRYDMPGERALLEGDVLLCRLTEDGRWTPQPTYVPAGASFTAGPLTPATAPGLFSDAGGVEHYQVFWIPRA
jgi:hypothetical protein